MPTAQELLTDSLTELSQANKRVDSATTMITDALNTPEAEAAAEQLTEALDNTARAERNIDLATEKVTEAQAILPPDVIEPPPAAEEGLPKHPKDSASEDRVYAEPNTLSQIYRNIKDGQSLILEDGSYGDFTFDRKFDKGIVTRSKNSLKAKIIGRWYFWKGEGHWLYDTTIATPSTRLGREKGAVVFNSNFIATKNKVEAICGMYGISNSSTDSCSTASGSSLPAHDFSTGWNDFVGSNTAAMTSCCHIKLRLWDGRSGPTPEFRDLAIYNNAFWDGSKSGNDACDETFNIYIGNTKALYPDNTCFPNSLIARNVALAGNQRRFLYPKRGVEKIQDNLCLGARNVAFTQRYGVGSWWGNKDARVSGPNDRPIESAIFGGGRGPKYDKGQNDIRGNYFSGTVSTRCGTSNQGKVEQQACDYGLMVGNEAKGVTTVGKKGSSNHPLDNNFGGKLDHFTLLNHKGQVYTATDNVDTGSCRIAPDAGPGDYYVPPVTTIRPEEVGLKG